jgi:hypothetical protein
MRRREFITLIGGAAASVSTPLTLCAQEAGRTYRIGFVSAAPREEVMYTAFFEELRGLGFVEGQNLSLFRGDLVSVTNNLPKQQQRSSNPRQMQLLALGHLPHAPHRLLRRQFLYSLPLTTWLHKD